jgi:hypothetical protein
MKLRLKGNAVRLRLTQPELDRLRDDGRVTEHVVFGPGCRFTYALEAVPLEALSVRYQPDRLTVLLPAAWVERWTTTSQVGFSGDVEVGDGTVVKVLVEKDFKCLHRRPEDQEQGAFPHPMAGEAS